MPTFDAIATRLARRLYEASDQEAAIEAAAGYINNLVYDGTDRWVTKSDRLFIADLIKERLQFLENPPGQARMVKEADNRRYLVVVRLLKALL